MKKLLLWVLGSFVFLTVVGMIIEAGKSPEEKAAEAAERQQLAEQKKQEQARKAEEKAHQEAVDAEQVAAALPLVTAAELANAYDENTVAADQNFKGKKFRVSGVVDEIGTDILGDPHITLRSRNQFMNPQFQFDEAHNDALAKLKKGAKVEMVCIGKGDVAKTAMSGSCILLGDK